MITSIKRASGYNHVLVQGDDLWDIETAAHDIDIEKKSVGAYVHTNHCLSEKMKKHHISVSQSSKERYKRANEMIKDNMTKEDMITLLSDQTNTAFPISRENVTIGSVIIEPSQFLMHICHGAPHSGEYVTYEL